MKQIKLGKTGISVPAIIVGGMRLNGMSNEDLSRYISRAVELEANYFDYADIYGNGQCEELFGNAFKHTGIKREDVILQSKCGICNGYYDSSKEHIIESVDNILRRMQTEYIDILLIHRPDALVEPDEVARAFEELAKNGKVKYFGVSNHNSKQIELLQKYIKQDIQINQLQLSVPVSNMISQGLEVNMNTDGAIDRDGQVLDYCRVNDITIQAWSPFQMPEWRGCFIGNNDYSELNNKLNELAYKYNVSSTTIAAAWILRHPANMQIIAGTSNISRLEEIIKASDIYLDRKEWYEIYLSSGKILP